MKYPVIANMLGQSERAMETELFNINFMSNTGLTVQEQTEPYKHSKQHDSQPARMKLHTMETQQGGDSTLNKTGPVGQKKYEFSIKKHERKQR